MRKLALFIATFGGWGKAPKAPGTVGSLASLIFAFLFLRHKRSLEIGVIISIFLGLWSSYKAGKGKDYKWIVIDETAGMWLSLLGFWPEKHKKYSLTKLLKKSLYAFLLFRLLDIKKPLVIKSLDKCHDATGIMGDDIMAGFIVQLILR